MYLNQNIVMKKSLLATGLMLVSLALSAPNGLVKMWEGVETLPTYRVNAPEKAPLFERDFAYQRSRSVTTIFGLIII